MDENKLGFWLLTYDYFKEDIKKPEDGLIVLVHWLLLKNDFQVLGSGSENEIAENEQPTDILPENWSQNVTSYYMRYTRDKTLYLLNGVKAGDNSLIFNFYNVTTKHVSSAALGDISTTVKIISDVINNKESFLSYVSLLQKDLINPMHKEKDDKKVASTQTQSKPPEYNPGQPSIVMPRTEPDRYLPPNFLRNPYPDYGMPDLDPLGGLRGGGMIFDPMRVGNDRRGLLPGIPPTARFDPIRPDNPDPMMPGSMRRPNPDHMRPPDFDDDMYM